jgi:ubiquinone/menaquinone biosynthesis C-methylase UbiE
VTGPGQNRRVDDRSFVAGQAFILAAKNYWTREIYPALEAEYRDRAAASGTPMEHPDQVEALVGDTTLYRYYAWLERHLQRFKYSGRYGLQPYHDARRDALRRRIPAELPPGLLELDPGLDMPGSFTAIDIHQHPGGVWSDEVAGFVYERGARSTTPLAAQTHRDLHQRLADRIAADAPPARILDMGCGFGKSTRPFWETFRDADIHAIDISAPCLEVAAMDAAGAQARNIRYRQMNAAATDYPDARFDLVTSTMLVHEMPPGEIEAVFDEAHRVLAPGGRMVHLDFLPADDAFSRFIHFGHARRNNEPYMEPLAGLDVATLLRDRGFTDIEIQPFEEADGTLDPAYPNWRFPWVTISARRDG